MKKICIIGVGSAAVNIMDCLVDEYDFMREFKNKIEVKYGYISTNIENIHRIQESGLNILNNKEAYSTSDIFEPIVDRKIARKINYIAVGKYTCKGLGCFSDIEKAVKAYKESEEDIQIFLKKLTSKVDLVITVAAINGGCGTAMTPLINNYIKDLGIPIVTFVQRPAKFEGKSRREEKFNENINLFKNSANDTIIVDSEKVIMDEKNKISVISFFQKLNLYIKKQIFEYLKNNIL